MSGSTELCCTGIVHTAFSKGFSLSWDTPQPLCCPFQLSGSSSLLRVFCLGCLLCALASGSAQSTIFYLYPSDFLFIVANESYLRMVAGRILHSSNLSVAYSMLCLGSFLPGSHLASQLPLKSTFSLPDEVTLHILYQTCTIMLKIQS